MSDNPYHDHCHGCEMQRIGDLLERLADALAPTKEQTEEREFERSRKAIKAWELIREAQDRVRFP